MDKAPWVTNDPGVAERLRKADADYADIVAKASLLPLAQKVIAIGKARAIRDARYRIAAEKH